MLDLTKKVRTAIFCSVIYLLVCIVFIIDDVGFCLLIIPLLIRNSIDGANLFPSLHIILNKRIDLDLYVQIIRFFLLATSSFFLIPKYELMGGIISIIFAYFMAYILKYFVAKKIKYKGSISIFFMFTMFFSVLISHHISFSLDFDFFPKIILFFFIIIGFSFLDTSFNNSFLRHGIAASTRSLKINR
mgnify:CR=1 FL=1